MRQSDHVLYITLIDFLLQVLFLSLLVGVIYAAAQPMDDDLDKLKEQLPLIDKIKKATGISDLKELTDQLTRLGPLGSAGDDAKSGRSFKALAEKLGGEDEALKILRAEVGKGSGPISCLPNRGRLATFDAYEDRIEFRRTPSAEFLNVLDQLGLTVNDVASLSLGEFETKFWAVKRLRADCVFWVNVVEYSFNTRPRDSIGRIFIPVARHDPSIK